MFWECMQHSKQHYFISPKATELQFMQALSQEQPFALSHTYSTRSPSVIKIIRRKKKEIIIENMNKSDLIQLLKQINPFPFFLHPLVLFQNLQNSKYIQILEASNYINRVAIIILMTDQQNLNLNQFKRYLQNNQELIKQKYKQYFSKIPNLTLKSLTTSTLIDFIYDIFCITKYKNDPKTHKKITQSLTVNINDYINMNPDKINIPFDHQLAVQTLLYCIQNNDIFSVQYDNTSPKNGSGNEEDSKEQVLNIEVKKQEQSVDHEGSSQAIRSRVKGSKSNFEEEENQFNEGPDKLNFKTNTELIKKNAKLAFLNFCKNQMEVGGRKTFDQLEQESTTMTIGKLLVYAKSYGMLNIFITKQMLMQKFKKLAEGKRAIDFEKFYVLLTELSNVDNNLINRLELNDENLYKKVKFANYPFHTQDQNPRQMLANRNFVHKITSHSGKTEAELRLDLAARKNSKNQVLGNLKSLPKYIFKEDVRQKMQKKISPRDLSTGVKSKDFSLQLSFIDKIVSPQDNDQKYLGQYEMDHYHKKGDQTVASSAMLKRKDSIVDNIRKRIQQIEHSESTKMGPRMRAKRYQGY